ncbi:Trafficking protein particle complex subunit 1 [Halotydeus destructor]|nr:Trafficking protein particle complex subunit 1 [Halotydeus destructor]
MIYNFHLYHKNGDCLFSLNNEENDFEGTKLLYGFLYSLKSFSNRISPILIKDNNFLTYSTTTYQLIFLEMPTSMKMVLIVAPNPSKSNDYYKQMLAELYRTVYVEYVVKNPLEKPGSTIIKSTLFREKLVEFLTKV